MVRGETFGLCVRCGSYGRLTFEHIPPAASGNRSEERLYSMIDVLQSNKLPWDFKDRKYVQAQRGTGGYYLCASCNNSTGRDTVPSYLDFIYKSKSQNIRPLEIHDFASRVLWSLRWKDIYPRKIASKIILMISCMNGRTMVENNRDINQILNNNDFRARKIRHGLYLYIPSGSISVSYPVTARGGADGMFVTTGVYGKPFNFELEVDSHRNPSEYFDITNWLYDYDFEDKVTLNASVPIYQNNVGLPGSHSTKREILFNRMMTDLNDNKN